MKIMLFTFAGIIAAIAGFALYLNTREIIPYTIIGSDNDRPILKVTPPSMTVFERPYYTVIWFTQAFPGEPKKIGEAVWGIHRSWENDDFSLSIIKYGEAPPGYEETQKAKPLVDGAYYCFGVSKTLIHKLGQNQYELVHRDKIKL